MAKKSTDSVRNYQPFRYPGGKTKLAANPAFKALIAPVIGDSNVFYEGFLGSAAVTLSVALADKERKMQFYAADRDLTISGFWQLIGEGSDGDVEHLLELIGKTPTVELFRKMRDRQVGGTPLTLVERAYHAVFFNRTTFSGIAMAQPIGGFNQTSKWTITCRYNVPLLQQKVKNLRELLAGRLHVETADCIDWLQQIPVGVPLYLDPPYFVKGDALYPERMDAFQHGKLARTLAARTNWIMSYDICPEISKLYYDFAQTLEVGFRYSINGKKTNWKAASEYLIVSSEIDTRPFERLCFRVEEANAPASDMRDADVQP